MPELSVSRLTRRRGLQTFARANRLMPTLRDVELEYLGIRDRYINQLARIAQFEEELKAVKREGDKARVAEIGAKLRAIQDNLTGYRNEVRLAGRRSFAEAFQFCAESMLPPETAKAIRLEAEALMGRPSVELPGTD